MALLRGRSPHFLITVAVVASVSAALIHVYVRLQVIQAGYELSRESKLRHDLLEQNQKLRLELAVRKDPSVIERRARQELHMEPPDPHLIRVLQSSSSLVQSNKNMGPPSPRPAPPPGAAGRAGANGR